MKCIANPSEQIHIAWYCINAHGNRYEQEEIDFMKSIDNEKPLVLVCTQCFGENGKNFFNKLKDELHNTSIHPIRILAMDCILDEDYTKEAYGISELTDLTYELLPEAARAAFVAAQKVNKEIKKKKVDNIIAVAATAAGVAGATPIPFSDAVVLAPIQIGMITKIGAVYGLDIDSAYLKTIIASASGILGASFLGRAIVGGLLKLIPGAGSLVGGAISAATAAALTTTLGLAYYNALVYLEDNDMEFNPITISDSFVNMLKLSKSTEE